MLTTDLALRTDPIYAAITKRFLEHPKALEDAFARAWDKLLHRDMGPLSRYLGPWVPEPQIWQDPVPRVDHRLIDDQDVAALKSRILAAGLSVSQLVHTAWSRRPVSEAPTNAGRQRGAHPPCTREELGGERPAEAGEGAADA